MSESEDNNIHHDPENFWHELDDLEDKFNPNSEDEGKPKKAYPRKSTYKKPDKQKKISRIEEYENALLNHRKNSIEFFDPFSKEIVLKLTAKEAKETIETMRLAHQTEELSRDALRLIGLKRLKIIFKCNAYEHFDSVASYLACRKVPIWVKEQFEDLMKKKY